MRLCSLFHVAAATLIAMTLGAAEASPGRTPSTFAEAVASLYASTEVLAAPAVVGDAAVCDQAIVRAAARHDVPVRLMRAVALVESGKTVSDPNGPSRRVAWPWTVNMEGDGRWFDSQTEALSYVRTHHARGARSFDVGCMQVNYRWHGEAFTSLEEMFEPDANADYAAQFLKNLKAETGDWMRAAGFYHSRTPKFERVYRGKVGEAYATLTAAPPPEPLSVEPRTPQRAAPPLAASAGGVGLAPFGPLGASDGPLLTSPSTPLIAPAPDAPGLF